MKQEESAGRRQRLFSLAQHTVPLWRPPEMVYNAKRLGYDMVAIRAIKQGVPGEVYYDLARDKQLFRMTQNAVRETGIPIHDLDLIAIQKGTEIGAYEADLEAAAELGVSSVVCSVWTPDTSFYTDCFGQLCDLAGTYGLTVNLEFVTWAEVKTLKDAKYLLEAADRENARILVDTLHWYRSRVSLQDLRECPMDWFELIHVCDIATGIPDTGAELARSGRQERLYPGEGAVAIAEIIRNIRQDAVIGIEIPHKQRLAELGAYEFACRCLERTKSYWDENNLL